jgi:hypothetical protein
MQYSNLGQLFDVSALTLGGGGIGRLTRLGGKLPVERREERAAWPTDPISTKTTAALAVEAGASTGSTRSYVANGLPCGQAGAVELASLGHTAMSLKCVDCTASN